MGGGALQSPQTGEIVSCDIEIHLNDDKQDSVNRLVELMNIIGIPKGSALLCTAPEIKIEVGTWRDWLFMSMERIYQMKFMRVAISITSLSRWNQQ